MLCFKETVLFLGEEPSGYDIPKGEIGNNARTSDDKEEKLYVLHQQEKYVVLPSRLQ